MLRPLLAAVCDRSHGQRMHACLRGTACRAVIAATDAAHMCACCACQPTPEWLQKALGVEVPEVEGQGRTLEELLGPKGE